MSAPPTPSRKRSTDSSPEAASKRIKPAPEISAVTVQQQVWPSGSTQLVSWSSQGDVPQIHIKLCRPQRLALQSGALEGLGWHTVIKHLAINVANIGSAEVNVPEGLTPGEYNVCISSKVDDKVHDRSGAIMITCDTPPGISSVEVPQQVWPSGSTQLVSWSSQGEVPRVHIKLCRPQTGALEGFIPHTVLKNLAISLANTGSAEVKIPAGVTPGESFVLIESVASSDVHHSSSPFTVTCDTSPSISGVNVQQQVWPTGSTQLVSWISQGEVPTVHITLCRPNPSLNGMNEVMKNLAINVASTGSAEVKVPEGFVAGEYNVCITSSADRDVDGRSSTITITSDTPPSISSVEVRQQIWHGGSTQLVSWSSQGEVPQVHVRLCRPVSAAFMINTIVKNLAINLANTGSAQVEVPVGLAPGECCVQVTSAGSRDVEASSSMFTVDDEHRERCVRYALLLLGLPPPQKLPYAIVRKIAVEAATESPPAAAAASTSGAAADDDAATSADGDATDAAIEATDAAAA